MHRDDPQEVLEDMSVVKDPKTALTSVFQVGSSIGRRPGIHIYLGKTLRTIPRSWKYRHCLPKVRSASVAI